MCNIFQGWSPISIFLKNVAEDAQKCIKNGSTYLESDPKKLHPHNWVSHFSCSAHLQTLKDLVI